MSKSFIKLSPTKEVKRISQILEPIEYKRFFYKETTSIMDLPKGLKELAYRMSLYNRLRYYFAYKQLAYSMRLADKTPKEITAIRAKGDLFKGVFTNQNITNYVLVDLVYKLVNELATYIKGAEVNVGKIMLSSFGDYPNKFGVVVDAQEISVVFPKSSTSKLLEKLSEFPELMVCNTEVYTRYAEDYVKVKQIFLNEEYILSHYYKEEITDMLDILETSVQDEKAN